jgi:hypothetical protein
MRIFDRILDKLGLKCQAPAAAQPAKAPFPTRGAPPRPSRGPIPMGAIPIPKPTPIPVVDVVGKLEGRAAEYPQKLNCGVSIVDLLKRLGLEGSLEARKGLAADLGCPADKMGDSAPMRSWVHKTVVQILAENGGNIPMELLD